MLVKKTIRLSFFLLFWLPFIFAGCSDKSECLTHADCPKGQLCQVDQNNRRKCVEDKTAQCPSSCQKDEDCAPCADGRNSCLNSKCAEKPKPQCPKSCTKDEDCRECPEKRRACVKGECTEYVAYCPSSCQKDDDCSDCPPTRRSCVNSKCSSPPPQCPSSCQKDEDCKKCEKGAIYCVNNRCVDTPPSTCPARCQKDDDCLKCPDEKTYCVNGICDKKDESCPDSCAADSDCVLCPNGMNACVNGKCATRSQCPKFCMTDADCAGCAEKDQHCVSNTCGEGNLCPDTCKADIDCNFCPDDRYHCRNKKCIAIKRCPKACVKDSECAPCGKNYVCVGQVCSPAAGTGAKLGEKCDSQNPCDAGLLCIKGYASKESICMQSCTKQPNICLSNADGRTSCVFVGEYSGRSYFVCAAEAKKGAACGITTKSQIVCQRQTPPLYCSPTKKVCLEFALQKKEGGSCYVANKTTNKEPYKICDEESALICDEKSATCVKGIFEVEGHECDPTGKNTGTRIICKKGLACIPYAPNQQLLRCHVKCKRGQPNQCQHNRETECVTSLNGIDVCLDTKCKTNKDCTFKGYECVKSSRGNYCAPPIPTGPVQYGGVCSTPYHLKGCDKDLTCVRPSYQYQTGFCTKLCNGKCPPYKDGKITVKARCLSVSGSARICIFFCNAGKCPPGLVCRLYGGQSVCIPPK